MKKEYLEPETEIIVLALGDIVTLSDGTEIGEEDNDGDDW